MQEESVSMKAKLLWKRFDKTSKKIANYFANLENKKKK